MTDCQLLEEDPAQNNNPRKCNTTQHNTTATGREFGLGLSFNLRILRHDKESK